MRCHFQTFDRPLKKLFIWYTKNYLVDYYYLFIVFPIFLTLFLSIGLLWANEQTIFDAKKLYTPATAPSWNEEKIFSNVLLINKLIKLF